MRGLSDFFFQWIVHTHVLHFNVAKGEQSQQKNQSNGLENKRLLFILTRNKKKYRFFQLP